MSRRKIRFSRYAPGPDPREAADRAAEFEKLGFGCVWVADHLADLLDETRRAQR